LSSSRQKWLFAERGRKGKSGECVREKRQSAIRGKKNTSPLKGKPRAPAERLGLSTKKKSKYIYSNSWEGKCGDGTREERGTRALISGGGEKITRGISAKKKKGLGSSQRKMGRGRLVTATEGKKKKKSCGMKSREKKGKGAFKIGVLLLANGRRGGGKGRK